MFTMREPEFRERRGGFRSAWAVRLAIAFVALIVGYATLFWVLRNPYSGVDAPTSAVAADEERLLQDVAMIAAIRPSRSVANPAALVLAEDIIEEAFSKTGCAVSRHAVDYKGNRYHNIVCAFGPPDAERVILGAHYDVYQDIRPDPPDAPEQVRAHMPGADDNASGVAGILEVARMVSREAPTLSHRLELVAFTLEEVVDRSATGILASIGSFEYAQKLKSDNVAVKLMVSVEMIGYFDDASFSQGYPALLAPLLYAIYPNRADFIGVIGTLGARSSVARVRGLMQVSELLPVYSINAPAFVPGIDRSDHKHFWSAGYPAVMVTDTADFRNVNYHRPNDTPQTLDYGRMARVVEGLYQLAVRY